MDNLIDEDFSEKISLDELYERKFEIEQNRLSIYKNILARVHKTIKTTARQKHDNQFCFYLVPEILLGIPRYDVQTCTSYIIEKLNDNGFKTKYTHPNLLFISWNHYIPIYKRLEIKKLTGKNVDGFGNLVKEKETQNVNMKLSKINNNTNDGKDFKKITNYKPTGIYNLELFNNLKKINNS
tara:strand:+ start:1096 stop:1641 length:546 start_codon:yes stop_codon:yes gene_type:complete